jgi:hypothetical protein
MTVRTPTALFWLSIALGAFLIAFAVAPAEAERGERGPRTLTVSGLGTIASEPDEAHVSMGVQSTGKTAQEALDANTERMNAVFAALKASGIADKDMQTSNFSVSPRYKSYPRGESGPPVITGYIVSNQLTVRVRDLGRLGSVLDKVTKDGANQLGGIRFAISNSDELLDEARRRAVADALRRAKLMAEAAGVTLGPVLSISELGSPGPRPAMMARSEAAYDSAVPVAAGEQILSANVHMEFAIE